MAAEVRAVWASVAHGSFHTVPASPADFYLKTKLRAI